MPFSLRGLILLTLLALLLSACRASTADACQDSLGCQVIPPAASLPVGYLLPLSGDSQAHGQDILEGLQIAIDDRQGFLLGHELELVGEDADCSSNGLLSAATRLSLQKRLVPVFGFRCPQPDEKALLALSNAGLVSIGFTAAQADIPGYFHLMSDTPDSGQAAARFAYAQLSARRAVSIAEIGPANQEAQRAFDQTFQASGGEIAFQQTITTTEVDDPELSQAQLQALAARTPDVIFLSLSERPGNAIIRQLRSNPAFGATSIIEGEELFSESLAADLGHYAEGLYLVAPRVDSPSYPGFLDRWTAKYGRLPGAADHSLAYDAAGMLFEAITRAARQLPDGSLSVSRQALRQALGSTGSYPGLSGEITCRPSGECLVDRRYALYVLTKGTDEKVKWPPSEIWNAP